MTRRKRATRRKGKERNRRRELLLGREGIQMRPDGWLYREGGKVDDT